MECRFKVEYMLIESKTKKLIYMESQDIKSYEINDLGTNTMKIKERFLKNQEHSYMLIRINQV